MVRKGSPVRVRKRALREDPASAGSSSLTGKTATELAGQYRVRNSGLIEWQRAYSGPFGAGHAVRRALRCVEQLQLSLSERPAAAELLTIAEAARRVRCCERTIRRAIDSGALCAGKI